MRIRSGCTALIALGLLAIPRGALTQIRLAEDPVVGRVKFIFTGGTLVDNTGLNNGVNCIEDSGSAVIRAADLPPRPTLVRATLTVSGSLIGDDGPDYEDPDIDLLDTFGLNAEDGTDRPLVLDAARADADRSVDLLLPGESEPVTLSASAGATSVDAYNRGPSSLPSGNVAFFTTRFDLTELLRDRESLAGRYEVSELLADVCFGREARCANGDTCGAISRTHPNAAASFSLLLIVESESLPLRRVAAFEGLNLLFGSRENLTLESPEPFSNPAAGRLAFYGLEGDLAIAEPDPPNIPCGSFEFIEVDGDSDPSQDGRCLVDDDNPVGNLFNSTINVQPADPDINPVCTSPDPITCCSGDALCGTTGVDIDQFDISDAISPGQDELRVTIGTGTDLFALAKVVLETDLFEPILDVDTQIRVPEANNRGQVQLGAPLTYVVAISNTGNIDAVGVDLRMSVPPRVTDFELLSFPASGEDTTAPLSGLNGTGLVSIDDMTIPAGSIAATVFRVTTECGALNLTLRPTASIGTSTTPAFQVSAPPVTVVGPGIRICDGIDPTGPFLEDDALPLAERVLRGGGCRTVAPVPFLLVALVVLLRRRRHA